MKKLFTCIIALMLSVVIMTPSSQAHHWSYHNSWTNEVTSWWNGCTGLGAVAHNKSLWIDTVNGESFLFLFDHEVWASSVGKVPYAYDVTLLNALHYVDESNNSLGGIGHLQWSASMHHTVLMPAGVTFSYGHSDLQVWSEAYEDVKYNYETTAELFISECGGFPATLLANNSSSSTGTVQNIPTLLTSNQVTEEITIPNQSTTIIEGIQLKSEILKKYESDIQNSSKKQNKIVVDKEIEKWVERIAIDMINLGQPLPSNSEYELIISSATNSVLRHKAILSLADKYNVKFDKLNEFIENEKEKALASDAGKNLIDEVVKGLGLKDVNELFFEYDYDHHQNNYIWANIQELYELKYPQMKDEQPADYRSRLLEIYYSEIDAIMEQ